MQNLENKVVIITVASSGIGEATARVLAQNGAKVVLGARREERLEELGDSAAYACAGCDCQRSAVRPFTAG